MSENGNGTIRVSKQLWAAVAAVGGTILAGAVIWATYVTATLLHIEAKVSTFEARISAFEKQLTVFDDFRSRGYTAYSMNDLMPRLTKIELQLERMMEDVKVIHNAHRKAQ